MVIKMPTDTDNSIVVEFLPAGKHSLSHDDIRMGLIDQWRTVKFAPRSGLIHTFKGCSLRRIQNTLCNNVAATVHTLLEDTFPQLATSISHI